MEMDLIVKVSSQHVDSDEAAESLAPSLAFMDTSSRLARTVPSSWSSSASSSSRFGPVEPWSMWPQLAMAPAEAVFISTLLSVVTVSTVVGNVLVILSVLTYKPLRIAPQNFFLVSLAVADIAVALLVLPLSIAHSLMGHWAFGLALCQMWLTCDVLCCTASILGISAVALDRYWAIHDPIRYAQKRTLRRVLVMILMVWLLSAIICLPPLVGWNDWGSADEFNSRTDAQCRLTSQRGYVIYSSVGSFFLPLVIMTAVYAKIFIATRRRLRERRVRCDMAAALVRKSCNVTTDAAAAAVTPPRAVVGTAAAASAEKVSSHSSTSASIDVDTKNDVLATASAVSQEAVAVKMSIVTDVQSSRPPDKTEVRHIAGQWNDDVSGGGGKQRPQEGQNLYQFVEERQRISLSKERRAARILGVIMGVFIVCWLPFFIMYVAVPFCSPSCTPSVHLENFITWLGYTNSALNPIIYTIFNMDFRRAFARLLRCRSTMHG